MSKILCAGVLAAAIGSFAQLIPETVAATSVGSASVGQTTTYKGYNPAYSQGAVLGSSHKGGAADLLLLGNAVPGSVGLVVVSTSNVATVLASVTGIAASDVVGGMAVLRPMDGPAQSALAVVRTNSKIGVYEFSVSDAGVITATKLAVNSLPASLVGTSDKDSRLVLLDTTVSGATVRYNMATSDPNFDLSGSDNVGRVDFFTLDGSSWGIIQPNTSGLTSSVPSQMFVLGADVAFGNGLAAIGDVDGDGVNDLAVKASYPTINESSVFIVLMADASTPKNQTPVLWTGTTAPWLDRVSSIPLELPIDKPRLCNSFSSADLDGDNKPELLLGCIVGLDKMYGHGYYARVLSINAQGGISKVQYLGFADETGPISGTSSTGPLAVYNPAKGSFDFFFARSYGITGVSYNMVKYTTRNTQVMRNYAIEAGADRSKLVGIDSLFHRKGTGSKYTSTTLSGLVDCEFANDTVACKSPSGAEGSWSSIEIAVASGDCRAYDLCKTKDTIHVYSRSSLESNLTALRIPERLLASDGAALDLGPWFRWSYIPAYPILSSVGAIESVIASGSAAALTYSRSPMGAYSLQATAGASAIDTVVFSLTQNGSSTPLKVPFHVAPAAKIKANLVPATPGEDTLYVVADGDYIALPTASAAGALYTYDIAQTTGNKFEVVGNYLHLLSFDEGDKITVAYTESREVKTRTLVLSTKEKPVAVLPVLTSKLTLQPVAQGVLVQGLQGAYTIRVSDAHGKVLAFVQGSSSAHELVSLPGSGLRIVMVQNQGERRHLQVVR